MNYRKLTATLLTCAILLTNNAYAIQSSGLTSNQYELSCDTNITSDIEFANNRLLVSSTTEQKILFSADGTVTVDGKQLTLTRKEMVLTKQYYNDVEASIPMVVDITIEALNITSMALSEVFSGLLGRESELPSVLTSRIDDITSSIKSHVYQNPDSLTFNTTYLKADIGLGDNIEEEIEGIKEEIVASMMGQIMIEIGKSLLSGDGDFSQLESRMNTLGADIEQKAEALAKNLEEKSLALCSTIKRLDDTEKQLRNIKELRYLDAINLNNKT